MAYLRDSFRRGLAVCLAIGGALGALFALALLATAITGKGTPSSILLGGVGFILLVLSVLAVVFAFRQWTPAKPGQGG